MSYFLKIFCDDGLEKKTAENFEKSCFAKLSPRATRVSTSVVVKWFRVFVSVTGEEDFLVRQDSFCSFHLVLKEPKKTQKARISIFWDNITTGKACRNISPFAKVCLLTVNAHLDFLVCQQTFCNFPWTVY